MNYQRSSNRLFWCAAGVASPLSPRSFVPAALDIVQCASVPTLPAVIGRLSALWLNQSRRSACLKKPWKNCSIKCPMRAKSWSPLSEPLSAYVPISRNGEKRKAVRRLVDFSATLLALQHIYLTQPESQGCLTTVAFKPSIVIEQATSSYSFRFPELSQPI